LVELAKIGNNINQIARALNIIKNADSQEQRKLDIFSVLLVLKGIQSQQEKLYHLGAKRIALSTLTRLNEEQPTSIGCSF
jgi:hypothetical protein